jgi:hypothetical protein
MLFFKSDKQSEVNVNLPFKIEDTPGADYLEQYDKLLI